MRTREGMTIAKAKGKLRGKQPSGRGLLRITADCLSNIEQAENRLTVAVGTAVPIEETERKGDFPIVFTVVHHKRRFVEWCQNQLSGAGFMYLYPFLAPTQHRYQKSHNGPTGALRGC